MNINRHNYEEFFLLYVDNELSSADRTIVEEFLQQNVDLAEELEMLKQTILPTDNTAFDLREVLYKKEDGISQDNYEEYFLLSVDKELDQQQEQALEKFILKHPELQSEFTLLAKTRLEPELLEFAGKEKLFRKEAKEKPLVFMNWMKISVAAAIVGLISTTWFFNKSDSGNAGFVTITGKKANTTQEVTELPKVDKTVVEKKLTVVRETASLQRQTEISRKIDRLTTGEIKRSKEEIVTDKKQDEDEQIASTNGKAVIAKEGREDSNTFEKTIASARIDNNSSAVIKDEPKTPLFASNSNSASPEAIHAVYKEIDTRENDDDNTIYLGSAEINKNKLKGLFKKAASLFERKNNYNEGDKTVKIAGFEIKSK